MVRIQRRCQTLYRKPEIAVCAHAHKLLFRASDPNSDTVVGFGDLNFLSWWSLDMYHVTLTFDLELCVSCCAPHCDSFDQVWARLIYPFLTYNTFTSDILRYSVTLTRLTFDPSTLNVRNVSAVAWSNSEPNLSEIQTKFLANFRLT